MRHYTIKLMSGFSTFKCVVCKHSVTTRGFGSQNGNCRTQRAFVPDEPYCWRGAKTHALVTTIGYPAEPASVEPPQCVGPSNAQPFAVGSAVPDARAAVGRFPLIVLSHGGGSAVILGWRVAARILLLGRLWRRSLIHLSARTAAERLSIDWCCASKEAPVPSAIALFNTALISRNRFLWLAGTGAIDPLVHLFGAVFPYRTNGIPSCSAR